MADNTFLHHAAACVWKYKMKRSRKRQRERLRKRERSGAKVFAILFEVPIQQGKLNFRQCLIVFCVNA